MSEGQGPPGGDAVDVSSAAAARATGTPGSGAWVLAIDLGSSGLKVGAVGIDGTILAAAHRDLVTDFLPGGGVEQDTAQWWDGVRTGVRELLEHVDPAAVTAVGITGQYASTIPVDADGAAVGPCLMWADDRGGPYARKEYGGLVAGYKPQAVLPWLRYTGGAPSSGGADPTGHALFLKHDRPQTYAATTTLLEPVDYLGLRLTGRAAGTPASLVASWLTDNRQGRPLRYVPELVRLAGRDPAKLPELLPSGSLLGSITAVAAAELGLPAGVPVVTGVPDLHAAYLASGATADYAGHFSISTTAWVSCAVPFKKTDILHQIASVPGVRPGQYLVINNHETAGVCLQWLRDGVLAGMDDTSYDDLVTLAAKAEPGSGAVIFTPWLKGERSPVDDRRLRAAFLNVSLDTDRADLVRAVLEGVAYNMRWLVEATDKFVGRRLDPLRVLGGGARSDLWCQIHADVLGRTVDRVADPAVAQLRGAAMYSLVSLGRMSLAEVPALVPAAERFTPDPAAVATYEPLYQAFTQVYGNLKRWYHKLNR
ncbi:MAG: FGGY-family carbohydrate kinase [Candidatus Nanopelagicales bacterium]